MKLSLTEENNLLLDGVPLSEGQVLAIKLGEGEESAGRIARYPDGSWHLKRQEFVGHTYLDIPLNGRMINSKSLVIIGICERKGRSTWVVV